MADCSKCKRYSKSGKYDCAECKPDFKMTNADNIRAMNDKELAVFLKPFIGTLTEEEIIKWLQTEEQEEIAITPEMKADMVDCIKETKIPGGGKDCNTCSINKTNYHGKAFCEVEQIKEKILQGAVVVTPDTEKYSAGTCMERITKYINDGKAVCFAKCEKECVYGYMMDDVTCDCEVVQSAKKRLAEYEALGVTPEQIREIDRLYAEKCKEVAELEKRLQEDTELVTPSGFFKIDPYRELVFNEPLYSWIKAVENALGFKLFFWQKHYIEIGIFRQYGKTTAEILRELSKKDENPIDAREYKKRSIKERTFYDKLLRIKKVLDDAGVPTRVVVVSERDYKKWKLRQQEKSEPRKLERFWDF